MVSAWSLSILIIGAIALFSISIAVTLIFYRKDFVHPNYLHDMYEPMLSLEADGQLKLVTQETEKYKCSLRVPSRNVLKGYNLITDATHSTVGVQIPTHDSPVFFKTQKQEGQQRDRYDVKPQPYHDFSRGSIVVIDHVAQTEDLIQSCFQEEGSLFGSSAVITKDGEFLVVGAQGVPMDRAEGVVVLMKRSRDRYVVQYILRSPNACNQGLFGARVVYTKPYLIVSAPYETHWEHTESQGCVYLYHWDGGEKPTLMDQFRLENIHRLFGIDVSLAHVDTLWELLVLVCPENHRLQKVEVLQWKMQLEGCVVNQMEQQKLFEIV